MPPSEYAETWIVKLTNGKYMISTWQTASTDTPDQYLFSDDGLTFVGPFALPFNGQSTALEPWKDGSVLVVYNQRKETPVGVWLVWAKPDKDGSSKLSNRSVSEQASLIKDFLRLKRNIYFLKVLLINYYIHLL